jgi:hypothetical protein
MLSDDGINLKSDYGESDLFSCNLTSGDYCSTSDGVSLKKGNYCLSDYYNN